MDINDIVSISYYYMQRLLVKLIIILLLLLMDGLGVNSCRESRYLLTIIVASYIIIFISIANISCMCYICCCRRNRWSI